MSANKTEKLTKLLTKQEEILSELKKEADGLSGSDFIEENQRLSSLLETESEKKKNLENENESLKKQLNDTKSALFRKMADEKLSAFQSVQRRIDNMYYRADTETESRLASYERNTLKSIEQTKRFIEQQADGGYGDILGRLEQIKSEFYERQERIRRMKEEELRNASQHNNLIGEKLRNEPLTENEKRTGMQQKSIESFIGLNILSKAGIFLFLIGIILLGRYAYIHLADGFKEGLIFLLGAVLVAAGEVFHSKEKTVFSTALISGGVSVLYAAAVTGYFAFGLFSEEIVFMICIAITAAAIAISYQVKSEVVCSFAAIGGYLPLVAIFMMGFGRAKANAMFLPVSCVYFTLLAVTLFVMTYNKKWNVAQYIGYFLHMLAIGGVASCAWELRNEAGFGSALVLAVAFAVVSYVAYLLMPAVKIINGKALTIGDIMLLSFNTVSGAVSINITVNNCFNHLQSNRAMGIVFLAFAVIYGVLMFFSVKEKKEENTAVVAITSISALVFSMFIIPLVFGFKYAAIAWALEGLVLAYFSLTKGLEIPEYAGIGCMALSVLALVRTAFENTYSTVSLISFVIVVAAFWLYSVKGLSLKNTVNKTGYVICELFSALMTVILLKYALGAAYDRNMFAVYSDFFNHAFNIAAVMLVALVLRMGVLKNGTSLLVSDIAGVVTLIMTAFHLDASDLYNYFTNADFEVVKSSNFEIINIVLLVVINLAALLFFSRAVSSIIANISLDVWLYTAALAVSSLLVITITLMHQFDVEFSSYIISALYIAAACIMLAVGFKKSYTVIRSGGLAIILVAFAKLCFVDTFHLESGWKIASYFAFGAILIVISYFYQRFDKKLQSENKTEYENEEIRA